MGVDQQELCTAADAFTPSLHGSTMVRPKRASYADRCRQIRQKHQIRSQHILLQANQVACEFCWPQTFISLSQQRSGFRWIVILALSVGLHAAVVVTAVLMGERFSPRPQLQPKRPSKLVFIDTVPAPVPVQEAVVPASVNEVAEQPPAGSQKNPIKDSHSRQPSMRTQKRVVSSSSQPTPSVYSLSNFSLSNESPDAEKNQASANANKNGEDRGIGTSAPSSGAGSSSHLTGSQQGQSAGQGFIQARPKGGRIRPDYPAALERREITGTVELSVHISETGEVKDVKVIESAGYPELDRAAVEAARRERWLPAQKNGQVVATWRTFRVNFGF